MSEDKTVGTGGGFCDVVGCQGEGTTTRWIMTEKEGQRQIHVCWKHAEGDLTESDLDVGSSS